MFNESRQYDRNITIRSSRTNEHLLLTSSATLLLLMTLVLLRTIAVLLLGLARGRGIVGTATGRILRASVPDVPESRKAHEVKSRLIGDHCNRQAIGAPISTKAYELYNHFH